MSKRCCAESCFNSQQINKNVSYFGFPKYKDFAVEWALAAGRSDLLDKKLTSITKYFLCGEHFSNDSFFDPPHNTRLKKTLNPVNIPIPTIFKCNISKYMPKAKPNTSTEFAEADDDDDADDVVNDKKMSALGRIREGPTLESLSVFHDHYNYTDITNCASSFLSNVPDIPPNIDGNVDLGPDSTFSDENFVEVNSFHICRLCAATFASSENIVEISTDVLHKLNGLIANTMHTNSTLPMIACTSCLDRLNTCLTTLDFFKQAQSNLRRTYPST